MISEAWTPWVFVTLSTRGRSECDRETVMERAELYFFPSSSSPIIKTSGGLLKRQTVDVTREEVKMEKSVARLGYNDRVRVFVSVGISRTETLRSEWDKTDWDEFGSRFYSTDAKSFLYPRIRLSKELETYKTDPLASPFQRAQASTFSPHVMSDITARWIFTPERFHLLTKSEKWKSHNMLILHLRIAIHISNQYGSHIGFENVALVRGGSLVNEQSTKHVLTNRFFILKLQFFFKVSRDHYNPPEKCTSHNF